MFDQLPFGLEKYIFTLVPDWVFIYLPIITIVLAILLWRYKYYVLFASYTILQLCHTVIFRHVSEGEQYCFIPLKKLLSDTPSADNWWEVCLNVVLFIPIGVLLTCILGKDKWKLAIGIGALLSFIIELLQLTFKRGMCETDDVIFNTLGCGMGVAFVVAISMCFKKKEIKA